MIHLEHVVQYTKPESETRAYLSGIVIPLGRERITDRLATPCRPWELAAIRVPEEARELRRFIVGQGKGQPVAHRPCSRPRNDFHVHACCIVYRLEGARVEVDLAAACQVRAGDGD